MEGGGREERGGRERGREEGMSERDWIGGREEGGREKEERVE